MTRIKMNLVISDEEKAAYSELFKKADTTSKGVVLPNDAVAFFVKSGLSQETLGLVFYLPKS